MEHTIFANASGFLNEQREGYTAFAKMIQIGSLDPDAIVYVKDGSDWSVEKASYLVKAAEFFSDNYLFKSDKLYDIVVVVVK